MDPDPFASWQASTHENHGSHLKANTFQFFVHYGANPRRPAWEIGQQLKTKTHHVYGVHSEPPKTQQNDYHCSNLVLTRQKCGRVLCRKNSVFRSWHFSGIPTIRPLEAVFVNTYSVSGISGAGVAKRDRFSDKIPFSSVLFSEHT
jgi:hypothetical protein